MRAGRAANAALLALCALLWSAWAGARDQPQVRARLNATDPVWVGQEVTLVVELLVPGYFDSAASFDLPDPEGVLLMPPAEHPLVGNETIDGTLYTVQQHELRVWPMRAGAQTVPPLSVRFAFKRHPLDRQGEPASVTTGPLSLTVRQPPGTEGLGTVVSARGLKLEESWKPLPGSEPVRAGTGFTRTVTFTAPGVPGMVFPPFPADDIEGLGVYAKRQVLDRDGEGGLVGVRRDRITYIAKRPGQFTIPAVSYSWFDLDSQTLKTVDLPARTLNVIANPDMASADPAAQAGAVEQPLPWPRIAAVALLVILVLLAALSRRLRGLLARALAPLRPVRLQPLNPTEKREQGNGAR